MAEGVVHEGNFQRLTRLGFAARGFLYILIAALVILTGRTEDLTGALKYLGHGLGKALLIVLAVGMAGYGLWRLSDAAFGMESGRDRWKAWCKRIAAASSGVIYCWLAFKAGLVIMSKPPVGDEARHHAAAALHVSGGELLLIAAGLILVGAAAVQFYKAFRASFLEHLDGEAARQPWIKWLGRVGYAARGPRAPRFRASLATVGAAPRRWAPSACSFGPSVDREKSRIFSVGAPSCARSSAATSSPAARRGFD